jgi:hypothetical protein
LNASGQSNRVPYPDDAAHQEALVADLVSLRAFSVAVVTLPETKS